MAEHTSHEDYEALARAERAGHELRDANALAVGLWSLSFVVLLAFAMLAMYWFLLRVVPEPPVQVDVVRTKQPIRVDEEDLQANQHLIRQRQERRHRQQLESYGWVDQPAGVAHIPIERAMELMAAEGEIALPASGTSRDQPQPPAASANPTVSPRNSAEEADDE